MTGKLWPWVSAVFALVTSSLKRTKYNLTSSPKGIQTVPKHVLIETADDNSGKDYMYTSEEVNERQRMYKEPCDKSFPCMQAGLCSTSEGKCR